MPIYYDVVLADQNLNRVTSVPVDYYIKDTIVTWSGFIYNDTDIDIVDCRVATSSLYDGVFSISGGGITGFSSITSNWDTTYSLGPILSGGLMPIVLNIFISGGSSLDGLQTAALYISR
jgi:hypothetical protein